MFSEKGRRLLLGSAAFLVAAAGLLSDNSASAQNKREIAVRSDREKFAENESWIYNDLEKARQAARAENKPLMVVIRCVP